MLVQDASCRIRCCPGQPHLALFGLISPYFALLALAVYQPYQPCSTTVAARGGVDNLAYHWLGLYGSSRVRERHDAGPCTSDPLVSGSPSGACLCLFLSPTVTLTLSESILSFSLPGLPHICNRPRCCSLAPSLANLPGTHRVCYLPQD